MSRSAKITARPPKKAVQKRSQDTQKRFIKATLKLAARNPMHLVTSKAISEEAGTAWGSAQYLFGSKEDLMVASVRSASEQFIKLCTKEFTRKDYAKKDFENAVVFLWEAANKSNAILTHEIAVSCLHDKAVTELLREIISQTLETIGALISDCLTKFYPNIDRERPLGLLFVIETFFTGLHFRRNFTRPEVAEEKMVVLKKMWVAGLS